MVPSLSSISRGHLCMASSFLIPFLNSSTAFITSSELSDLIWYSSDLMECTSFTSSTIGRLGPAEIKYWHSTGDVFFIGWFIDLTDTMGDHRWVIMMQGTAVSPNSEQWGMPSTRACCLGWVNKHAEFVMLLKSTTRTCSLMHMYLFKWLQS